MLVASSGREADAPTILATNAVVATEASRTLLVGDAAPEAARPAKAQAAAAPAGSRKRGAPAPTPFPSARGVLPRRLGDYELLEEIAHGGAGVVYKARQKSLRRIVALKMMLSDQFASEEEVHRFRVEAEAAAALDHPNIVPVYEVGERDGHHYFTMKLIEGEMLSRRIRQGVVPPREAAQLLAMVAHAIHYGHQRGVLHRDLKPANILVENTGNPYVVDFGLAKRVEGSDQLTRTGEIMGTPSYMAPEQMAGRKGLTTAVDVYGLGATLYELLSGQPPFKAPSIHQMMQKVMDEEPAPPRTLRPGVDADLETICLKCLEKNPARRYTSAETLARDLERWLAGEPIEARPVTTWKRGVKWVRRRPAAAGLILVSVAACLGAIAGGIFYAYRITEAHRQATAERTLAQEAVVRNIADRLDSELRQVSAVPAMLGLGVAPGVWNDRTLTAWVRSMLAADPRIFGSAVAFEPRAFDPAREDYALYVHRHGDELDVSQLLPPAYRAYRTWDWYRRPFSTGQGMWAGPYFDEGGGNVPMVTYAHPIERDGRRIGVATIDLSLEYFRRLGTWVHEVQLGEGAYGFVVNADGVFISHPALLYRPPLRIPEGPGSSALMQRIRRGEPGEEHGVDFWTKRPCAYSTAPVRSTGWAFVAVLPE